MNEQEYTYYYIEEFTKQQYIKHIESLSNDQILRMISSMNIELKELEEIEDYEECCVVRDEINELRNYLT